MESTFVYPEHSVPAVIVGLYQRSQLVSYGGLGKNRVNG
jgi:hypothetical protein